MDDTQKLKNRFKSVYRLFRKVRNRNCPYAEARGAEAFYRMVPEDSLEAYWHNDLSLQSVDYFELPLDQRLMMYRLFGHRFIKRI